MFEIILKHKNLSLFVIPFLLISLFGLAGFIQLAQAQVQVATVPSFDVPAVATVNFRDITNTSNQTTLSLDKTVYHLGDTATLTINDASANVDTTFSETITATVSTASGGSLPLTLTETDVSTGVFTATFTLTYGPTEGTSLHIENGDSITVNYTPVSLQSAARLQGTIDTLSTSDSSTPAFVLLQNYTMTPSDQTNAGITAATDAVAIFFPPPTQYDPPNSVTVTMSWANAIFGNNINTDHLYIYSSQLDPNSGLPNGPWLQESTNRFIDNDAKKITTTITATDFSASSANPSGVALVLAFDTGAPGGGSGGFLAPGLVLNVLAGFGSSESRAVAPPSFGGSTTHYSDGLTLNQGQTKSIYDLSKYNEDTPVQVLVAGQKVDMTFKTFEGYSTNAVVHMGLYFIPKTSTDMTTDNSIASIVYDKDSPVQINDPNHILSDSIVSSTSDNKYQYTQFSFLPTKSFANMAFLVRAWNDHKYSTDVRMYDAAPTNILPEVYPDGVIKFTDWGALYEKIRADGYDKSKEMSHIQSIDSVFPGIEKSGEVFWLYDTNAHDVTLVIKDSDGITRYSNAQPVEKLIKLTYDACDTEQFKPYCTNNGVYGHQSRELSIPEIEHLFHMGAWQGKLPTGLSYEQVIKDLANQ